jgi:hypothetical protein
MNTKTREEVARYIERQFDYTSGYQVSVRKEEWHYGKCELRDLLDFIFGGPPTSPEEFIRGRALRNR